MTLVSLLETTQNSEADHNTGYIARFILETAKISQLFCHQIVWNMKANCYKDDAAEIVSSLHVVFVSVSTMFFFRKIL
jgi:hypothetical protein